MDLTNLNKDRKTRRKSGVDYSAMVYGKLPPQAKDLEIAILGALMLDKNALYGSMGKLFPEVFYVDAHQKVFSAIRKLYDKGHPVDILTVVEQLKKENELEVVGGAFYVTKITNDVVSGANIEAHILIVTEMYMKRSMIQQCGETISRAYEDNTDAFDLISETDDAIQKIQERALHGISRGISYYGTKVLEQHAAVKDTGVLGVSTGISSLNKVICGLVAPDLVIIAGRPGQGKTAFAMSLTYNTTILNNVPCAWFSYEMDGTQLTRRLASIISKIEHERIRNGRTGKDEDIRLGDAVSKICESKLIIEDRQMSIRDLRTRAHLLKKKNNIGYIVVDYLQLMSGLESNMPREQAVSEISRQLKGIAKELDIPVIALSQLSRKVEERPDKMPQLSDLRESGAIEQDADEVIFLMRPAYYHMEEAVEIDGVEYAPANLCIANIAKNRHGGTKHIALHFDAPRMFISELQSEEPQRDFTGTWRPIIND